MEGSEAAQMRVYWGKYFIRAKETFGVDVSWMGRREREREKKKSAAAFSDVTIQHVSRCLNLCNPSMPSMRPHIPPTPLLIKKQNLYGSFLAAVVLSLARGERGNGMQKPFCNAACAEFRPIRNFNCAPREGAPP